MEGFLMEYNNLKQAGVPVDFNLAAITGARISMAEYDRVAIVVSLGDSVGAAFNLELKQHDAAAAGTTKVLSVDNAYYHKVGAATSFTKVVPSAAADTYDLGALFAADEGIAVFEVQAEQLDVDGGFSYVSANLTAAGAAKIGAVVYLAKSARFKPAYERDI